MPAKTPTKRRRDPAAKQQALISAATRLFACRGYGATTTRAIADFAGCAEALIQRYFAGKSGLLFALMNLNASREVGELSDGLPLGATLEGEIQQLVEWEVDRMWKDRDFLRITVPQAMLDRKVGRFLNRVGPSRNAKAIAARLRLCKQYQPLEDDEIEALSHAIAGLGFVFGFMWQVVLGYGRKRTKKLSVSVAKILSRGIQRR